MIRPQKFSNDPTLVTHVTGTVPVEMLEREPQLFSASPDFARKNGGPLTRMLLRDTPYLRCAKHLHPVVDTRVHMLMPGMYPAIPGWHCDAVPRNVKGDQPDFDKVDPFVRHFVSTISSEVNGVSLTRFATLPVELLVDTEQVWSSVDLQKKRWDSISATDGAITEFGQLDLHTATPAVTAGWRLFYRLSFLPTRPLNKIRNHAQVYTTDGGGW